MAEENTENEMPRIGLDGIESKVDGIDMTVRQLLAEVVQMRSIIENALE